MNCFSGGQLSGECLESIFQTVAEGIMLIDTGGTIRYCNRSFEHMVGLSNQQIIGQKCCSLMKETCKPPPVCDVFARNGISNAECALKHSSGSTIKVLKNARVLRDSSGQAIGAVETLTDITVLKRAESKIYELEEAAKARGRYGKLVGKSHTMQELFNLIELAAASNATILITGETGTGKELVAQAIHENSPRRDKPFVKINCSAIPETLLESELFGHARGSFTGAIKDKVGRFEMAEGGTLFLDEIGELSALIQVKLLRFFQEREFERVGEGVIRKADVRIITATHRNLRHLIHEGRFREDLFYRLKVFPIHIASLRERKEDVGPLIDHFIARFNAQTGKKITGLTHDAAITTMDYCWPGNIRELENAIEHAFVTCQENRIGIFDLPLEIRKVELRKGICATEDDRTYRYASGHSAPAAKTLSDEEFARVVQECSGNKSAVARRLGIDRTTVWRRMKRQSCGRSATQTGMGE